MKILFGCDHGAVRLKGVLINYVSSEMGGSHDVVDLGTVEGAPIDYPDKAEELCSLLLNKKGDVGVLLCGTGIGISIAANKIPGIRCGLCHDHYTAKMCRLHNDANVLALGGRVLGDEVAKDIIDTFLATTFEGGRHNERLAKVEHLERK